MAKVSVTALQMLQGDYGTAFRGDVIEMEEQGARELAKAGVVQMTGVTNEGKFSRSGKLVSGKNLPAHNDSDKRVNTDNEKSANTKKK